MEPKELKEQLDRIAAEVKQEGLKAKQEFEAAVKDKAAASDVEAIKTAFHEYTEKAQEEIDKLREVAEKQGMKLKEFEEKGSNAPKDFGSALSEALKANADKLAAMKESKSAPGVSMSIKAAATMTTANVLPSVATAIPYSLASGSGEIIRIARRQPFLRQILNARPINGMYEWWAEQVNVDGAANTVAEGAAKPQADFDVQERTAKVEKIAAYAKMSKELLADQQAMRNFIEEEIRELVELKLDSQLYNGNGTSPNLKGIVTWATSMSVTGTPFATAGVGVDQANNFDVVVAAKAIMENNYYFTPDVMLVNPLDYGLMQLVKNTQGQYLIPPFATSMGMNIAGVQIYSNPGVTAGDFVIMDSSKPRLRMREEFNLDYGYEHDDFTKNLITVLGELRALLYLPTNYAGAVLKGTFATVRAAMETA